MGHHWRMDREVSAGQMLIKGSSAYSTVEQRVLHTGGAGADMKDVCRDAADLLCSIPH